jgi:hypothetical protein
VVATGIYETQTLAWHLHMHGNEVQVFPFPPATTVAVRGSALANDPRFPPVTGTREWIVGSSCGPHLGARVP